MKDVETKRCDQIAGALEVFCEKERGGCPDAVRRSVGVVTLAGQQSLCQRTVGDDDVIVRLGERQQVVLDQTGDQAVAGLVAPYPAAQRLLGGAPALNGAVAEAHLLGATLSQVPLCWQHRSMAGVQPGKAEGGRCGSRCDGAFAIACCAVLAAYNNIVAAKRWHRRWYPLVNISATAAVLAAAGASGLTASDIGLQRDRLRPGLRPGSRLAGAAAAGFLLAAVLPATRPALRDERIKALSGREIAYQVSVRIPVGTVLWEESAFRGVLQAALRRVLPGPWAITVTSGVFGIWHIRPTVEALVVNQLACERGTAATRVTAGVAATAAGGALLSSLRARSGSLAAPVLLHLAINCAGALAAWSVATLDRRRAAPSAPPDPA